MGQFLYANFPNLAAFLQEFVPVLAIILPVAILCGGGSYFLHKELKKK